MLVVGNLFIVGFKLNNYELFSIFGELIDFWGLILGLDEDWFGIEVK